MVIAAWSRVQLCTLTFPTPIAKSQINCALLTHAYIIRSGYLPLLYKNGFRGPIYAAGAKAGLCKIMLLDSTHIYERRRKTEQPQTQMNQRIKKTIIDFSFHIERRTIVRFVIG